MRKQKPQDEPEPEYGIVVREERAQLTRSRDYHVPGRRPTGIAIRAENIPPEMRPVDAMVDVPLNCSKRVALEFARAFTKMSVAASEHGEHCILTVTFPMKNKDFKGRSWRSALQALNTFLAKGAAWSQSAAVIDI